MARQHCGSGKSLTSTSACHGTGMRKLDSSSSTNSTLPGSGTLLHSAASPSVLGPRTADDGLSAGVRHAVDRSSASASACRSRSRYRTSSMTTTDAGSLTICTRNALVRRLAARHPASTSASQPRCRLSNRGAERVPQQRRWADHQFRRILWEEQKNQRSDDRTDATSGAAASE